VPVPAIARMASRPADDMITMVIVTLVIMFDFSFFEARVLAVQSRLPDMPLQAVMLTRLVHHLGRRLHAQLDVFLAPHGLNASSWSMLMTLFSCPEQAASPCRVADAVGQSRAHITRIADELVAADWLVRVPGTDDRRSIQLQFTEAGSERLQALLPQAWKLYESFLPAADVEEFNRVERFLRRWIASIEEDLEPANLCERKDA
jgi:MarR family transcriptional regulator, negative regulator of the multidrug operon emrRAB